MILGGIILFLALFIGITIYGTFSWGYVCFQFWHWFILPIFPALPNITFYQSVGLMFFISLFNIANTNSFNYNKTTEQRNGELVGNLVAPWITLFIGWLIRYWFLI